MFEQIKAEPIQFYHPTCPPPMPGQMTPQQQQQQAAGAVLLQQQQVQVQRNDQQQHSTVITINDDNKESLQLNVSCIMQNILANSKLYLQYNSNNILTHQCQHLLIKLNQSL